VIRDLALDRTGAAMGHASDPVIRVERGKQTHVVPSAQKFVR
jgi:hypothetical protein